MNSKKSSFLVLCAVMFFIFFQLLTVMIEATYTFGLLGTNIPPEIVYVIFLISPVLLLVYPRILEGKVGRIVTMVMAVVALVCWGAVLFLDTRARMIASGIGAGAMLLFFPAFLKQRPSEQPGRSLGIGLAFAILALIYFCQENFGTGFLPTTSVNLIPIAVAFVAAIEWNNWRHTSFAPLVKPAATSTFSQTSLHFLGLASVLVLIYFSFSNPAVIARWTGADYLFIVGICAAAITVFLIWFFYPSARFHQLSRSLLVGWNALFLVCLVGTILPYQIAFPLDPGSAAGVYPLAEPAAGSIASVALTLLLLLHPILYVDAILIFDRLGDGTTPSTHLAGGMVIVAVYQLGLIFAHIFTTVYDYIPIIGPLFRDRFWLVYAVPCVILLISVYFTKITFSWQPPSEKLAQSRWPMISAIVLSLLIIFIALRASIFLENTSPREISFRVLTYNLQQGYSEDGQKNFAGQLEEIRKRDPDIIGLQETDTARIAGGNSDLVRYLAGNLGMYSYYGPKTVTGTFGIALLSRYPIENPRTYFLYSIGEQTAVIEAQIKLGSQVYTIMVTHLGNDGPLIQQQQILKLAQGKKSVLLMGDFNFRPSSEQYRQTTAVFQDSMLIAENVTGNQPGQDMNDRIDHIFLSPGHNIISYEYISEGPSDHPGVFVELEPLP